MCVCICVCVYLRVHLEVCRDSHLFQNQELIQEVNTLAGEEFQDGLLSFEALRVRGRAHLGGMVLQELCQRVFLRTQGEIQKVSLLLRKTGK